MLEAWMRDGEGLRRWYLSAIHALSSEIEIQTRLIRGLDWCEVDYPLDLKRAQAMVSRWLEGSAAGASAGR
jgi:choline kinase